MHRLQTLQSHCTKSLLASLPLCPSDLFSSRNRQSRAGAAWQEESETMCSGGEAEEERGQCPAPNQKRRVIAFERV